MEEGRRILDDVEFLLELLGLELEPSAVAGGISEGTAKGTEHGTGQLGRELDETDKEAEEGGEHDGEEREEHEHGVEAELVELVVGVEQEVASVKVEHVLVVLGHKSHRGRRNREGTGRRDDGGVGHHDVGTLLAMRADDLGAHVLGRLDINDLVSS